jgi:hypothetical protein
MDFGTISETEYIPGPTNNHQVEMPTSKMHWRPIDGISYQLREEAMAHTEMQHDTAGSGWLHMRERTVGRC